MSSPLRVLVVDDDDDDVFLTTENLTEGMRGLCRYDRARTGPEALAALASGSYDVCLLDYRLGLESGLEVLREARASGCDVPVVMLTGAG
jgi:two-component system, cell cycle sensor histidine kinase and response regulator CckA